MRVIDLSSDNLGSMPLYQREGHTFGLPKTVLHSNKFFAVTTAKNNIQKRVKAVQIVCDGYTCMCARLFDIAVHCSLVTPAIKYNIYLQFMTNTVKYAKTSKNNKLLQFSNSVQPNHGC